MMTTRPRRSARARARHDVGAVVLGGIDVVTALGLGGIRSTVVSSPADGARFSRYATGWRPAPDHWTEAERLVDTLVDLSQGLDRPPLYFPTDGDLLVVSRHRDRLAAAYRFALADAHLVEDLVDKARFAALARRLGLPVPPTVVLHPDGGTEGPALSDLRPPLIVKPHTRHGLGALRTSAKAVRVDDLPTLHRVWETARRAGAGLVAQELIAGPETRIESHHAYIDAHGQIVAEFTGVKVRTHPHDYGHSTVLATTDSGAEAADVRALGRQVIAQLGVNGLVKLDLKRDAAGRLHLLEVNPRATLWAHPGILAGIDLLGCVHADLTGTPRPVVSPSRPGVMWCDPLLDLRNVRHGQTGWGEWGRTTWRSAARSGVEGYDPRPLLRGNAAAALRNRLAAWRPR